MTERERNLLVILGVVVVIAVGYNFLGNGTISSAKASDNITRQAALRLLNSRLSIETQYRNTERQLTALEKGFLSAQNFEESKVKLLKEIEQLAVAANLEVREKNIHATNDQVIAVSIGGTAVPKDVYRFLQQVSAAKLNLKVNRLQFSSLPEQRQLNYQIVLNTLLVEKQGER